MDTFEYRFQNAKTVRLLLDSVVAKPRVNSEQILESLEGTKFEGVSDDQISG